MLFGSLYLGSNEHAERPTTPAATIAETQMAEIHTIIFFIKSLCVMRACCIYPLIQSGKTNKKGGDTISAKRPYSPSLWRFMQTFTEQPSDSTLPQHMALTI